MLLFCARPQRGLLLRRSFAVGRQEERITSPSNDLIKLAKRLHRKKRRAEEGLCLLEGRRLIEDVAQHTPLTALLLADDADCNATANRVCRVPHALLEACCDTETPQGAVALAPIPLEPADATVSWALVLDAVSDPGNVGALVRTAAAAGVDAIVCVGSCADPYSPKALRAAMGATFRQPIFTRNSWALTEDLIANQWGLTIRAADAAGGSVPYDQLHDWSKAALVVGAEVGLSDDLIDILDDAENKRTHLKHTRIHVPIEIESLNAAVAGSVLLLDAHRQRRRDF